MFAHRFLLIENARSPLIQITHLPVPYRPSESDQTGTEKEPGEGDQIYDVVRPFHNPWAPLLLYLLPILRLPAMASPGSRSRGRPSALNSLKVNSIARCTGIRTMPASRSTHP